MQYRKVKQREKNRARKRGQKRSKGNNNKRNYRGRKMDMEKGQVEERRGLRKKGRE